DTDIHAAFPPRRTYRDPGSRQFSLALTHPQSAPRPRPALLDPAIRGFAFSREHLWPRCSWEECGPRKPRWPQSYKVHGNAKWRRADRHSLQGKWRDEHKI